jgi:hypothetical protein
MDRAMELNEKLPLPEAGQDLREPRDLRYRKRLFPDAERVIFDTKRKGFVPLPISFRKMLQFLSSAEVRIWVYLQMRASRHGICYPTMEEIAHEVGLSGRKNLIPHLKSLQEKGLISMKSAGGRNYYLLHDPVVALRMMAMNGKITADRLAEINDLLEELKQDPIEITQSEFPEY